MMHPDAVTIEVQGATAEEIEHGMAALPVFASAGTKAPEAAWAAGRRTAGRRSGYGLCPNPTLRVIVTRLSTSGSIILNQMGLEVCSSHKHVSKE
jgi:hypothetical protein